MDSREEIWKRLIPSVQELFISLYGSKEEFISPPIISVLEPYIIQYNDHLDDEDILLQLGFRIGAEVPRNADADEYLYWILSKIIQTFGITGSTNNNLPRLEQIINMTHKEYLHWLEQEGEKVYTYTQEVDSYFEEVEFRSTDTYHQRLLIFVDYYRIGDN